jgi:hypothetical protein
MEQKEHQEFKILKLIMTINSKTIGDEKLPSKWIQTIVLFLDLQYKFIKHNNEKMMFSIFQRS